MTTPKQAFSGRNSGNVAAGQRRSALSRQCPKCGRKSALMNRASLPSDVLAACRWCDYVRMFDYFPDDSAAPVATQGDDVCMCGHVRATHFRQSGTCLASDPDPTWVCPCSQFRQSSSG